MDTNSFEGINDFDISELLGQLTGTESTEPPTPSSDSTTTEDPFVNPSARKVISLRNCRILVVVFLGTCCLIYLIILAVRAIRKRQVSFWPNNKIVKAENGVAEVSFIDLDPEVGLGWKHDSD